MAIPPPVPVATKVPTPRPTPTAVPVPKSIFVEYISLSSEQNTLGRYILKAEVLVVDNTGKPITSAEVTGTFSGDSRETVTTRTNSLGIANFMSSNRIKNRPAFGFSVDDIKYPSLIYDPAANVETKDIY